MRTIFDWIRSCKSGAELLGALDLFADDSRTRPDLLPEHKAIGPPVTLFNGPCMRCWLHVRNEASGTAYCRTCLSIINRARSMTRKSRGALVAWGHVNRLPRQLRRRTGFYGEHVPGVHIRDENHFLLVMPRLKVKAWIQELLIYHGADLRGLIQIFPTVGASVRGGMDDILGRAIHLDGRFTFEMLRIRFYPNPYQVFTPHLRDMKRQLTFEVREFLNLLEMAGIFRSLLRPDEQRAVRELLEMDNAAEKAFNWGRFMGDLSPEARDMLEAWGIRNWSSNRVTLLYELLEYVEFTN